MKQTKEFITLDISRPIWERFFTVAPLVVIGTKEGEGYDMAPKHLAMPMGFDNYFGFVCTPKHGTYHNILATREFSVSFPCPDQITLASLSSAPRNENISKSDQIVAALPTQKATQIDALLLVDSYLHLECQLFKIIDGFEENSLITGTICAAFVQTEYARWSEADEQEQITRHPLLAYIANGRYASVSETYNFPYPKDFTR